MRVGGKTKLVLDISEERRGISVGCLDSVGDLILSAFAIRSLSWVTDGILPAGSEPTGSEPAAEDDRFNIRPSLEVVEPEIESLR